MRATILIQFYLLLKKNLINQTLRRKIGFILDILLPCSIALILLWLRGLWNAEILPSWPFEEFDGFKAWPPGLEAPYLSSDGKSEFTIFYAPKNNDTDLIMAKAMDQLNNEDMKWFSYEEFLFDEMVFKPLQTDPPPEFSEIKSTINAFLPWYSRKFKERQQRNYECKDKFPKTRTVNWAGIDNENCTLPTNATEKSDWIEKYVVTEIKGENWRSCNRQRRTTGMFKILSEYACGFSRKKRGNLLTQEELNAFEFSSYQPKTIKARSFYVDKAFQLNMNEEFEHVSRMSRSGNTVDPVINLLKRNARATTLNLTSVCSSVLSLDISNAAKQIHLSHPKVSIKAHGYASMADIQKMLLSTAVADTELNKRRLAAVDFSETSNGAEYTLRFPPSRMNYPKGLNERFREWQESSNLGIFWLTSLLKIPQQLPLPRGEPPVCTGGSPHYYHEGFLNVQSAINKAITEIQTGKNVDKDMSWILKKKLESNSDKLIIFFNAASFSNDFLSANTALIFFPHFFNY